jgi:hypothetical protein
MHYEYENHKEFFEKLGDKLISVGMFGISFDIKLEDLYQHFKARLLEEMNQD